ncbi:MAG: GHKL domain-containing protein [Acidobacteria bacterium]|nr:GHKL domain-containing protein [Acidobacteriota bacterium]
MTTGVKLPADDLREKLRALGDVQRATLNILEDFEAEKLRQGGVQRATVNILEDFDAERVRLEQLQQATLNILEDFNAEKVRSEDTQRALLNILEDIDVEKAKVAAINRQLEGANRELEAFTYSASHDLQEPLRMVASYTQLLANRYKGKLGPEADDFIGYAVDGAVRMQALIGDLLAYSRAAQHPESFKPTDCEAVFNRTLTGLKVAVQETGAQVTCDPLPSVMGVEAQLVQLLQNLISNAIKFRSAQAPQIHVSAQRNGTEWFFSVRDNGIGILPEHAERVFVIFQRLHSKAEYPGTGIGLAICKKIVERHGGRIWVESQPGNGATFCFTIPDHGEIR